MAKIEQQRDHFDNISAKYFSARKDPNHLLLKRYIWEYFFSRNTFPAKRYRVLEPMCGYGEGKYILEQYGHLDIDYSGFDYSQSLIDLVKKEDPDSPIYQQDVTRFMADAAADRYDLIILIGGLHHVYEHAGDVIRNLAAALAVGGHFITLEPTQNFTLFKLIRSRIYERNSLFDEQTEQAFDLAELNGLFASSGLTLLDQIYPGLLSYVLYYNPDAFPVLNHGGKLGVRATFGIDKWFMANTVGRKLSFATLSHYMRLR